MENNTSKAQEKLSVDLDNKNEAENALCLIEEMRLAWLKLYEQPLTPMQIHHISLNRLDQIDAFINHHFGKQKWHSIMELLAPQHCGEAQTLSNLHTNPREDSLYHLNKKSNYGMRYTFIR